MARKPIQKQDAFQAVVVNPRSGLSFIEQLQIVASNQCQKTNRPYLVGVNENAEKCLLTRPACKMWNCEACSARLARQWIARIINGVNRIGREWSFLTLTAHRKTRGAKSISNLRAGWKKFYNRILAKVGKKANDLHYVKVWEQHSDGSFHLHILIDCNFGSRWAKDNASQCGMGHQAEWHSVENAGQVAGYVAKYTLKNATVERGGVTVPKGLRRIEVSRNWPKLPNLRGSDGLEWIIKQTRMEQVFSANRWHLKGYEIVDMVKDEHID